VASSRRGLLKYVLFIRAAFVPSFLFAICKVNLSNEGWQGLLEALRSVLPEVLHKTSALIVCESGSLRESLLST